MEKDHSENDNTRRLFRDGPFEPPQRTDTGNVAVDGSARGPHSRSQSVESDKPGFDHPSPEFKPTQILVHAGTMFTPSSHTSQTRIEGIPVVSTARSADTTGDQDRSRDTESSSRAEHSIEAFHFQEPRHRSDVPIKRQGSDLEKSSRIKKERHQEGGERFSSMGSSVTGESVDTSGDQVRASRQRFYSPKFQRNVPSLSSHSGIQDEGDETGSEASDDEGKGNSEKDDIEDTTSEEGH